MTESIAASDRAGDTRDSCWGTFRFDGPTSGIWRIGPLTLWIERTDEEWRIAAHQDDDPWLNDVLVEIPAGPDRPTPPDGVAWQRFCFRSAPTRLHVRPRLADRPLVSRPERPVTLPAGQGGRFYVGSPAWVELSVADGDTPLMEVASYRPSDTWFGSPIDGSLCYAMKTHLRRGFADLPVIRQRIVTPLVIENLADVPLSIERLSLPVGMLSVYESADGTLWTDTVMISRDEDGDLGSVRVHVGHPEETEAARKLSEPREQANEMFVSRLFGRLFE